MKLKTKNLTNFTIEVKLKKADKFPAKMRKKGYILVDDMIQEKTVIMTFSKETSLPDLGGGINKIVNKIQWDGVEGRNLPPGE